MYVKSINFKKTNFSTAGFETETSWTLYQLGYRCCCGFNGILLSVFFFNLLHSANWTPHELEVINLTFAVNNFMALDGWSIDVSSCRRVIGVTDKVRDKQGNFLLKIKNITNHMSWHSNKRIFYKYRLRLHISRLMFWPGTNRDNVQETLHTQNVWVKGYL